MGPVVNSGKILSLEKSNQQRETHKKPLKKFDIDNKDKHVKLTS